MVADADSADENEPHHKQVENEIVHRSTKPPSRDENKIGHKVNNLWRYSSVRLRIAVALALSLTIEGLMRSNINMAMVCMVNRTALHEIEWHAKNARLLSSATESPLFSPRNNVHDVEEEDTCGNFTTFLSAGADKPPGGPKQGGELVIPKSEQALIFTAFYAGGLFIVMPGSYLCDRYGSRLVVFYGAAINVIGTFVTPFVARQFGSMALIALRFAMGCGQGILVPCMNVLITHWFPLSEKSTAIAIATTGNQLSVIVAMFLTAELCQFDWLGGWASAFYIYGLAGLAFCALWLAHVYDTPLKAKPRISDEELKYIHDGEERSGAQRKQVEPKEVPWAKILSSPVVWSTALCSFSQNFMNVGTVVYLPSYYAQVMKMNVSSVCAGGSVDLLTKILFASIADTLRVRKLMSHSAIAKLFNFIGSIGAGLCFLLLSFCDCSRPFLAISLAVSAVGLSSGFIPGYNTSVVCIAPRYTSSVASFSRLLGQIASVASPYMIGVIVVRGVKSEWQLAFWVMAFILISSGILFQLCGSAAVQEWALVIPTTHTDKKSEALRSGTGIVEEESDSFVPSKENR